MENNQSKEEPKVFIKPPPEVGTPQWCLKKYGTIVFSKDFMKRHIGYGQPIFDAADGKTGEFKGFDKALAPTNLSLEVWLGFVPEAYRDIAMELTREVAEDMKSRGMAARPESIEYFISAISSKFDSWFESRA